MTLSLFLELLIKSGLIAAAGLSLSALLARRPAAERALVLRAAVCLLLALPVFLWLGPRLPLALLAPTTVAPPAALPVATEWSLNLQPVADASVTGALPSSLPWLLVAGFAYSAGLAAITGRFLLGLWTLRRWTEEGRTVSDPVWTAALRRLDASGLTRLVASARVQAPLSWGLPPGVVLIGEEGLKRRETAAAVLAHELAHIRRRDWIFAVLSRLALALFWFNPLVWLLHAALAARTEEAADALAVREVEPRAYARALIDLACAPSCPASSSAALGMAGSPHALKQRIAHVMKPQNKISRPMVMVLSIGVLAAVATPLAAVELTAREGGQAVVVRGDVPPPPPPPRTPRTPRAAPPAPPAPPAQQALPAPPPPARPATTVSMNGRYIYMAEPDAASVRVSEQARAEAAVARTEARRAAETARAEGQRVADQAQEIAEHAQIIAARAQQQAQVAMRQARVEMSRGADEMDRGADNMRASAQRLRDPAHRAQVIAENRARGNEVTDAELIELSRRLPEQAADMNRQAQQMREQAASHGL